MRHLYLPALTALLLTSCSCVKEEVIQEQEHIKTYSDYSDIAIEWSALFSQKQSSYCVYFYSETCGHCNRIKDDVFSFIDYVQHGFYLCKYSDSIPIKSCSQNTVGKTKLEDVYICGTPSLIGICKKKIDFNLCGESAVLSYIKEYTNTN